MFKHFSGQSGASLELERVFRRCVRLLGEQGRNSAYEMLTAIAPHYVPTRFEFAGDICIAHQANTSVAFPRPVPLVNYQHIANGYRSWLGAKYALPGFVEVEQGDLVFDCGGYVGGFSLASVDKAAAVHVFEPAPLNAKCTRRNLSQYPNVVVNEAGLYSHTCELDLNLSDSGVDHSLLTPDKGDLDKTCTIKVWGTADYCRKNGLPCPDFMKIEAEGSELEVLDGLEEMRPAKLAIDVSPERDGISPAQQFLSRLSKAGYDCNQRGQVLFALRLE